jgi:hypothetical protein
VAAFDLGSKNRLTRYDLERFPGTTLRDRLGRAVCEAGCLPRKEFFEAWELARRVRRRISGRRIVDVAGGHGLLGQMLWLLDQSSASVLVVDRQIPASAHTLHEALSREWPRLSGRVEYRASDLSAVALSCHDLVVSCHACGALTDTVIAAAVAAQAAVAVMPCCHDAAASPVGPLTGWMDEALAIDALRAVQLSQAGYTVTTTEIPSEITPKHRVLMGVSLSSSPMSGTETTAPVGNMPDRRARTRGAQE